MKKEKLFRYENYYLNKEQIYSVNKIDNELKILKERLKNAEETVKAGENVSQAKRFISTTYPRKTSSLLKERAELTKNAPKATPLKDFLKKYLVSVVVFALVCIMFYKIYTL